ncbi:MAG: DUF4838 domain-containing protein [Clostridia bacterium]|nr:DUF4838 domain-containing protein [Clostridia bacterium]
MKKIISLALALIMLGSMAVSASAMWDFNLGQSFVKDDTFDLGDVNSDSSVDGKDALSMKASIAGASSLEIDSEASDFDADGSVSAKDSYSLKLVLSGTKSVSEFETVDGKAVQVYRFTVGGNDISEYSIVLNSDATDENNSYFAALNLKKYIKVATGVDIPIVFGEDSLASGKMIRIVEYDIFSEEGQEIGIDGLKYEVKDGDLYLYGALRGTMYSVFEILEDYLGFRFYSNYETYLYKARTVDIPEGTVYEFDPYLDFRHAGQTYGSGGAYQHYFANKLCGFQLYAYASKRYGTLTGPIYSNAHSFLEYWKMGSSSYPEDTTGMTDAEMRAARFNAGTFPDAYGWQPCATSDKDYNTLFEGMLLCNLMSMDWGNPLFYKEGVSFFSFSILDNQNYCACRNCRKIAITQKEGYSGLYLQLYNRAAVDVQDYYPGIRLYGIVYAKDFPKTIKPDENLIILYCGISCDNHILGQEECYEAGGQLNGMKNDNDIIALDYWGKLCKETGAELWFWIYPVTYGCYLAPCPNIPNLYHNTKYLIDNCNVTGIFYEGGGRDYMFETLKAYATVQLMWDTSMTYEDFIAVAKEFLYMYYGDGYEELWEYILMQTEAGDQCGTCFINNFDRPGDMYSYEYLAENYGEMRELLEAALAKANTPSQKERVEKLMVGCDFLALSSLHTDWYLNGENTDLYCERYSWMYNYIKDHDMDIFDPSVYFLPDECTFDENPMIQFYDFGSRRPGIYP